VHQQHPRGPGTGDSKSVADPGRQADVAASAPDDGLLAAANHDFTVEQQE
jgi:hypothetical protein